MTKLKRWFSQTTFEVRVWLKKINILNINIPMIKPSYEMADSIICKVGVTKELK